MKLSRGRVCLTIGVAIFYGVGGFLLQEHNIIIHPAAWAFYGSVYGMAMCGIFNE